MSCLICSTVDIINGPLCTFMKRPPHISGTVTDIALPHREPYTAYASGLAALIYSIAIDVNGDGNISDEIRTIIESSCREVGLGMIGSGYPKRLKGNKIPLSGRITAVADVFDALTSKRPYRAALPIDEAFKIIKVIKRENYNGNK